MKINKCKLCGNENIRLFDNWISEHGGGYSVKEIECTNCGLGIRRNDRDDEVTNEYLIKDWNKVNDI